MSEHVNWKRTLVTWVTLASAAATYSLTPETWSPFAAAAVLLVGWYVWESMPRTVGDKDDAAEEPGAEGEQADKENVGDLFGVASGSLFFGLLAALILPGIGEAFGLSVSAVYATGILLAAGFALWVRRSHRALGALVSMTIFLLPVLFITYRWSK